jgi:ubiquinone/menaquinone biosynthesis C-methylase UbiE
METDPHRVVMEKAYARWAPIYDVVCGPIFLAGRRAAASAACEVGGRILEIGVGTGLSFDDYDATTRIVGIDLSEPMIAKAKARLETGRYPFVESLHVMDATSLSFQSSTFDCVVAQFVITLVDNPERVLDECARVVRPGGEIILVNHLYSEKGVGAVLERWFARFSRPLGLRPEFPFARLQAWAHQHPRIATVERTPVGPMGVYSLVRFRAHAAETLQSRAA